MALHRLQPQTTNPLEFTPGRHHMVTGMTGSGKSHWALQAAEHWAGPVVFWNPQDDDLARHWVRADCHNSADELFRGRWHSPRVSYVPHWQPKIAAKEAAALVHYVMHLRQWPEPLLIIWDEADLLAPQGRIGTPLHEIAQRGRKRNVFGVYVTQFPAQLDKGVVRNCLTQLYWWNPYANQYYRDHGLPGDQIIGALQGAAEHSYMRYDSGRLSGPHRC